MGQRPTNQKSKAVTSVKCQQYAFGLEASDKTAKVEGDELEGSFCLIEVLYVIKSISLKG